MIRIKTIENSFDWSPILKDLRNKHRPTGPVRGQSSIKPSVQQSPRQNRSYQIIKSKIEPNQSLKSHQWSDLFHKKKHPIRIPTVRRVPFHKINQAQVGFNLAHQTRNFPVSDGPFGIVLTIVTVITTTKDPAEAWTVQKTSPDSKGAIQFDKREQVQVNSLSKNVFRISQKFVLSSHGSSHPTVPTKKDRFRIVTCSFHYIATQSFEYYFEISSKDCLSVRFHHPQDQYHHELFKFVQNHLVTEHCQIVHRSRPVHLESIRFRATDHQLHSRQSPTKIKTYSIWLRTTIMSKNQKLM